MKVTGRATPGHVWATGCECREVLIDWVIRTVYHPYFECPHYGSTTQLDVKDEAPL